MTVEERLERHEIPVKAEFLKCIYADSEELKQARPSKDQSSSRDDKDSSEPPKKKGRYTKASKREHAAQAKANLFQGKGICNAIVVGDECSKGDQCKFSHDLQAYLDEQPPSISDRCWVYEQLGKCPHGYRCRFSAAHVADGKLVENKELWERRMNETPDTENALSKDIQISLRKKKIPFLRAKAAVKKHASNNLGFLKQVPTPKDADLSNIVVPERKDRKLIDWKDKLILAPLTTIGNLPYRRICKGYGVDITVGEMALATQLLNGSPQEWALVKRHQCEDVFGVQLAGSHANSMAACAELLTENLNIDFLDINCGCPIDVICNKGAGSSLMGRKSRLESICRSMVDVMGTVPLTVKIRTGLNDKTSTAHTIVSEVKDWGVSAVTLHGRSKEQRYTKVIDIDYMKQCGAAASVPFIANGDVYSWQDAVKLKAETNASAVMVARGAIIKPWVFKEINEQKDFDISGTERMDMIQDFVRFGLEHWGSDQRGIENIRHFLLNWMSFLCRYVPVGIVEHFPVAINHRPPAFFGRDDRETLLSSTYVQDWIKISEMYLGPIPDDFDFVPKHRANAYPNP